MSGIMAFHYRRYQIAKNLEGIKRNAYNKLSQMNPEDLLVHKENLEAKWKKRNFFYKIWTFGEEPIELIEARKILGERI